MFSGSLEPPEVSQLVFGYVPFHFVGNILVLGRILGDIGGNRVRTGNGDCTGMRVVVLARIGFGD